jgi:DNA-directed RNA polymerase subunit alpha
MHIIHNIIGAPKILEQAASATLSRFTVQPLPSGFGVTLGNSLRRIMLSSIPGCRVTGVKIKGVTHEYTTIPGVKDSVLDILLNLKGLIVSLSGSDLEWIHLTTKKAGVVTAADIKASSSVTIHNMDCYISEIDRDGFELDMSIRVEKSVGYTSLEDLKDREEDVNVLLLDANFSPVVSVKYDVKSQRVADMTNLDSLEMTVETNGVMSPKDVLRFSGDMLSSYFSIFNEEGLQIEGSFI